MLIRVLVLAIALLLAASAGYAQKFGKFMAHLPSQTGCASVCLVLRIL